MEKADIIKKAASPTPGNAGQMSGSVRVGFALGPTGDRIFYDVCIDLPVCAGLCAEAVALVQRAASGKHNFGRSMTVWKDSADPVFVVPICGRCREFMRRINPENLTCTEVVLDRAKSVQPVGSLPYHGWWKNRNQRASHRNEGILVTP